MQKQRAVLFFLAGVVWLSIPLIAAAQGLVPCGDTGDLTPGTLGYAIAASSCDLCGLGQLMQNIINFLIGFSISVAAAMFAYAGFLYLTGGSNPEQIGRAHKIFRNVFIGFLVAISAWLVVQTLLSVVFDDNFWVGGNWNELQCSRDERLRNASFGDLVSQVLPNSQGNGSDAEGVDTSARNANLVPIEVFNCKNAQSCQVSSTVNIKLQQMQNTLGEQASQYQITETGINTTVTHASGSNNLDMSCFGLCSGQQVVAAINAWPGQVTYETNSQSDYNEKLSAGVPASNMLLLSGTFDGAGNCTAGVGKCITAPHMSLKP